MIVETGSIHTPNRLSGRGYTAVERRMYGDLVVLICESRNDNILLVAWDRQSGANTFYNERLYAKAEWDPIGRHKLAGFVKMSRILNRQRKAA